MDSAKGRPDVGGLEPADQTRFLSLSRSLFAVVDATGTLLRLSPSWAVLLGRPISELLGRQFVELMNPDDVESTRERLRTATDGEHHLPPLENRYLKADGSSVWLRWDTQPDRDGSLVWCIARDVTAERRRAQQQEVVAGIGRRALEGAGLQDLLVATVEGLTQGLELPFAAVAQVVPGHADLVLRAAVGLAAADTSLPRFPHEHSLSSRAIASGRTQLMVDKGQPDEPYSQELRRLGVRSGVAVAVGRPGAIWGALTAGDKIRREFDEGEVHFLEQLAHVLASAIERLEVEQRLHHQATHDSLTGLPNRELLREHTESALQDARRSGSAVGLLLCDLDGFKDVNDSLGHAAGDAVLQQLAARLLSTVGEGSTVARLGGGEFALCIVGPETELEVLGVADDVIRVMRPPFSLPGLEIPLSTSIGVAVSPTHGRDSSTLLRHADVAMYRAKSSRLGWALYDASLDAASADRLALTSELRAAVEVEQLVLHYQPVVDLADGKLRSVEALCRWPSTLRGSVPPTTFIPLAEQTRLILPLTCWAVREASEQVRRWQQDGHELQCAVNLSMAAVLDARASAQLLRDLIAAAPLVTVEITESWLADARSREVLLELAEGGVELALDDFGTGFSSLAALRSFPVRRLKLDRQFVLDLDADGRGQGVLKAVAELAAALGMDVVAEGVEDEAAAAKLRAAGVELGQGFLWSPALSAQGLAAWAGWA